MHGTGEVAQMEIAQIDHAGAKRIPNLLGDSARDDDAAPTSRWSCAWESASPSETNFRMVIPGASGSLSYWGSGTSTWHPTRCSAWIAGPSKRVPRAHVLGGRGHRADELGRVEPVPTRAGNGSSADPESRPDPLPHLRIIPSVASSTRSAGSSTATSWDGRGPRSHSASAET